MILLKDLVVFWFSILPINFSILFGNLVYGIKND